MCTFMVNFSLSPCVLILFDYLTRTLQVAHFMYFYREGHVCICGESEQYIYMCI